MKIYVARHGQTIWNSENKVCGITDIELTDIGIKQATELSTKLVEYQIDIIISSPLKRARITAEILSRNLGMDIIIDNRLLEQNYGVYEGVSRDSKDFIEAKKQLPSKLSGGESLLQVAQRVYNLVDDLKEKYSNEHVLLVTHGSICRVIHTYFYDLTNEAFGNYYTGNCQIEEYIM